MDSIIKVSNENCGGRFVNLVNGKQYIIYGLNASDIQECKDILAFETLDDLDTFIKNLQYLKERIEEDNAR